MNFSDILSVIQWWSIFFLIGIVFLPPTFLIFNKFFDKGYIFSKIIGIALISYTVFILGILKILPFTEFTVALAIICFLVINIFIFVKKVPPLRRWNLIENWKIFLFEELLFIAALFFWSYIRAHQPDIHGLEKYMDFGFINSILRSEYFPPRDMWFTPLPINYYYFGHLITAVLTKLSGIPSFITYNLMLSTIFAFTFTASFSIGANLICQFKIQNSKFKITSQKLKVLVGGLLTAFILNFAGNLHTIYLLFKPYQNENPVPFWQLIFSPLTFPNSYWYPNATRFIENTIHEFPIYSSVVSDLHGHYIDVPFVLLTIAVLFSLMIKNSNNQDSIQNSKLKTQNYNSKFKIFNFGLPLLTFDFKLLTLLLGFILAIMYMTNAWDGIIYFLLSIIVLGTILFKNKTTGLQTKFKIANIKKQKYIENILNLKSGFTIYYLLFTILILGISFFLFSLPFNLNFKPFASGIGVLCAPEFLTNIGKLGPLILEKGHCQKSPWWQLLTLYGFFYFWVVSFVVFLLRFVILSRIRFGEGSRKILRFAQNDITKSDIFVGILIILSTLLIIIPEFIYVKDIYPAHYRANTMFKLVYQSFIMLSICSGYIIVRLFLNHKSLIINRSYWKFAYWIIGIIALFLVMIYPYFAINSYYNNLKTYYGLDGISYLENLYPTDYQAILWINKNIKGQPVILEAQGDSYTDYARISANTGLSTILGWAVHEWLWRGTYDIPAPRITEVKTLYETSDLETSKQLIKKHNISFVFFGDLERQKYPNLNEEKFKTLGKTIYQKGNTKIYKIK